MIKRLFIADCHNRFPDLGKYPEHDIMLMGDMVDNGTEAEYKKFEEWLMEIKNPMRNIWMVPGNHDLGNAGLLYNPNSLERFDNVADKAEANAILGGSHTFGTGPLTTVLVNSCLKTKSPHDFAQGRAEDVTDQLLNTEATSRVTVLLHHDPFAEDTTLLLKNAGKFVAAMETYADYVFFGHTHLKYRLQTARCEYLGCPAVQGNGIETWEQTITDSGRICINTVEV